MTTQFLDERLPEHIEAGADVGPRFLTTVTLASGGAESRNVEWSQEKLEANISYGMMSDDNPDDREDSYRAILTFFRKCLGRAVPFRFRDPSDWEATKEPIYPVSADGLTWQLAKTYSADYRRKITRPDPDTVKLYAPGGAEITTGWRFDVLGMIVFDDPPNNGVVASFEFDVPMRFDNDRMSVSLENVRAGQIGEIMIVQVPE